MKWLKNLQNIIDKSEPGKCPFCGSVNTDYSVKVSDEKTMMGYGVVWCNDCKNAFHISRIKKIPSMKSDSIPQSLKF